MRVMSWMCFGAMLAMIAVDNHVGTMIAAVLGIGIYAFSY